MLVTKFPFRKTLLSLLLMAALLLGGCGFSFGLTDSGSDSGKDIDATDYLDLGILDRPDEEVLQKVYETYTLEYGTYTEDVTGAAAIFEPVTYLEKAQFDSGTMVFDSFLVAEMDYVKKGDPIAAVSIQTDSISIKEAELAHERLLTQYENAKAEREESIKDRDETLEKIKTDSEKQIRLLQWQIADLNWAKTDASYQSRIKSSTENITQMKKNANTKTLNAAHSGYVYSLESIDAGDYIKNGQNILSLVPSDKVFLSMNDKDMSINYGKKFDVSIRVSRNTTYKFEAYSVNPSLKSVYFDLNTGKAYFEVNARMIANMPKATISITGTGTVIENVLLVPADAVEKVDNSLYVTVLNDDGSIARLPFISGGNTREYYWVISGLEAGMKVIHD